VLWAGLTAAPAQGTSAAPRPGSDQWERLRAAAQVPLDQLPPAVRDRIRLVVERPTLYSHGPVETFLCRPPLYYWFLDHPDRAVLAWRRIGAKCTTISDRGGGRFGWADDQSSDISWQTVYAGPDLRVWFAEGQVRPAALLPLVPVRAVVVLRHEVVGEKGRGSVMRHQADLFVHTDSKAAALVTRLLGPSAPRLAEQGLVQLEFFFSALVWYLHQHPERAQSVLPEMVPALH
jgi:hypothetical protein